MATPMSTREPPREADGPDDRRPPESRTEGGSPPSGDGSRRALEAKRRQRARERHERLVRSRRRRAGAVGVLLILVALLGTQALGGEEETPSPRAERPAEARPVAPATVQLRRAAAYARARTGNVSFAVLDTDGRIQGVDPRRSFSSASVVKAMILVAYLELAERRGSALSELERARLKEMIHRSDNRSATRLANLVGTSGLRDVARRAGMAGTEPLARPWGRSETNAEDQARLFSGIDRLAPSRYSAYAQRLLSSIVPEQRWGIPRGAVPGSTVLFKGGWVPGDGGWTVHQVARVEHGGRRLSMAVMTDDNPSQRYGEETVEGVAARLLR
jgi:hypothetical protein